MDDEKLLVVFFFIKLEAKESYDYCEDIVVVETLKLFKPLGSMNRSLTTFS